MRQKSTDSGRPRQSLAFGSACPVFTIPSFIGAYGRGSLKNHGADAEVDAMFDMGAETMKLLLEEKMKFEQGDGGMSFGCVQPFHQTRLHHGLC